MESRAEAATQRISTTQLANKRSRRAGFSLLEMLVVLALMSLTLLIVVPRGATLTDRVVAHAVFFDFERQLADLRRQAYRKETMVVFQSGPAGALAGVGSESLKLQPGWSYQLNHPVVITAGGACSSAEAEIFHGARLVMRLSAPRTDCKFIRTG